MFKVGGVNARDAKHCADFFRELFDAVRDSMDILNPEEVSDCSSESEAGPTALGGGTAVAASRALRPPTSASAPMSMPMPSLRLRNAALVPPVAGRPDWRDVVPRMPQLGFSTEGLKGDALREAVFMFEWCSGIEDKMQ